MFNGMPRAAKPTGYPSAPTTNPNDYVIPFGLTMAGISTQAFVGNAYQRNRLLFGGKELHSNEYRDGGSLDWYDFGNRM